MNEELKRLNIEVSSKCNYRCVGCPNENLPRGYGNMMTSLFFKIFEEAGNRISQVMLWNYGEPLLHPNIAELLEGVKNYSCKKTISTTGWKLEDFQDLNFMISLDEIIVSINGITQEVYNIHQRGGYLSKVTRGVRRLAKVIDPRKTKLIMQAVATKNNLDQLVKTHDFAAELGFHEVIIKSFNVMDNRQETFKQFVPIGTLYSRYEKNNPRSRSPAPEIKPPCLKWMVINWDGSVNPCCWDYNGRYVLGNVKDTGVYGVWDAIVARKQREEIMHRKFLDICIDCSGNKKIDQFDIKTGGQDKNAKDL